MADCNRCNDRCGTDFREAVCVHTDKIYDSCRDKDCLENVRVYLTGCGQEVVDKAINVKCTKAEIIWVFTDIEPVPFNRGFYSVDLKYFFKITLAVFTGVARPTEVEGLATFDKKVILFGSEGNAKVFESKYKQNAFDPQLWRKTNMPHAIVEVVDYKRKGCFYGIKKPYFTDFFHIRYHEIFKMARTYPHHFVCIVIPMIIYITIDEIYPSKGSS